MKDLKSIFGNGKKILDEFLVELLYGIELEMLPSAKEGC